MRFKIKSISFFLSQIFRSLPLSTWLAVAGLVLFLWLWVFGHQGLYQMEQIVRMKRQLLEQKVQLEAEKKELEGELKRLDDPRYLKHLIHKDLGYVESGEVMIKLPAKK